MGIVDSVILVFKEESSMRRTAHRLNVSEGVVKKILLTENLIDDSNGEQIRKMRNDGCSVVEISRITGKSISCINTHLPYEKGTYKNIEKSKNAIRIRKCRLKKEEHK